MFFRRQLENCQTTKIECSLVKTITDNAIYRKSIVKDNISRQQYTYIIFNKQELQKIKMKQHIINLINKFQSFQCEYVRSIVDYFQEKDRINVVIDYENGTLQTLIENRKYLTEFQCKFFANQIYNGLIFLESQNCTLQYFELSDIDLDKNLKVKFNFMFFLNIPENSTNLLNKKIKCFQHLRLNKIEKGRLNNNQRFDYHSWHLGANLYKLLTGISLKSYQSNIALDQNNKTHNLISCLLNTAQRKFNMKNILIQPFFQDGAYIPSFLPKTILYCPPTKQYQRNYLIMKKQFSKMQLEFRNQTPLKQLQQKKYQGSDRMRSNSKIYHQLCVKNIAQGLSEDRCYIQEFCDITTVFGYGYKLKNGLIGFCYNDRTFIMYRKQTEKIYYYDQSKQSTTFKQQKIPDENNLKKKFYILQAYMKSIYLPKNSKFQSRQNIVYIKQYIKVKNAKLFLLSNNTVQSIFIDKSQILCKPDQSLHYDKKNQQFKKINIEQDSEDVITRQTFTKELACKFFNWPRCLLQ